MSDPVLTTERLILREYRRDDLDALAQHFEDPDVMAFYPATKNRAEAAAWIERNLRSYKDHGFGHWVVTLKGEDLWRGNVGFWVQEVDGHQEVELGWHVARGLWRRGVATEAALGCIEYGRGSLGTGRIVSMIRPENFPSIGVAQKLGMRCEKRVQWRGFLHDVYVLDERSQPAGKIEP